MIKKIGIVIICVCVILAVLGLNSRFNYQGLTTAAAMVKSNFNEISDNFSKTSAYTFIVKNWTPESTITVDSTYIVDLDSSGRPVIGAPRVPGIVVQIYVYDDESESFVYNVHREFTYSSEAERDKALLALSTFRQDESNKWWEGLFNSVGFGGATLVNVIYSAGTTVWDTSTALVSLLDAFFYLLGF